MTTFTSLVNNSEHDIKTFYCNNLKLFSVIAIHRHNKLPAIGGCRFLAYKNFESAITDSLKLSSAMSDKAAFHGLNHGGGKMVVAAPKTYDRLAVMKKIGMWVDSLNGSYITASDSGTNSEDMDIINSTTKHVASPKRWPSYRPSYFTALGVLSAMQACLQLKDKTILIQGAGEVGRHLTAMLIDCGAKVLINDINLKRANFISNIYSIKITKDIYEECDIFSPCALGGILNSDTLPKIKANYIIGAANNQFSTQQDTILAEKLGFHIVPDYVANGGGLIQVAGLYSGKDTLTIERDVLKIRERTSNLIETA